MREGDTSSDRQRAQEDEVIDERRRQVEGTAARRRLSQRLGVADDVLLQRLEAVGLSEGTALLLHVVPLVHVAWIDGTISARAAHQISVAARSYGMDKSSEADRRLQEWLWIRPSNMLFDGALLALNAAQQQRTPTERDYYKQILLERCTAIAAASGEVLGSGQISSRQQDVLDRVRRALDME